MAEIGRQVKYGVGKETTPGTPVGAGAWINQLSFGLKPRAEYKNNESAYGVLEKLNSSTVIRQWSEGSLEAKLTTGSSNLLLLGAFGSVSTATNSDASGNVRDHTFNLTQNVLGQALTFVRKDGLSTEAYALGAIGQLEINMELDDYVKINADVLAKTGVTTTATPAFADEKAIEFVAKHFSVKTATTVAGLSGATNVAAVESCTLTLNANREADYQAGTPDPYAFSSRGYDIEFEISMRYNDRIYETAYKNGTNLAMQITLANTDTVIGTSANPKFVFTAPRIYVDDWDRDEDQDGPIMQTVKGTIHLDPTAGYALRLVETTSQLTV